MLGRAILRTRRVSIHAPAWGATDRTHRCSWTSSTFQFTLPRGERHEGSREEGEAGSFNSRSRVGSDQEYYDLQTDVDGFNSRSRVGSDMGHHVRIPD